MKKKIEWKEIPLYAVSAPRDSSLNVLLNTSAKGCSKLYSRMKDSFSHVSENIVEKWKDSTAIEIETISVGRSFMKHHQKYKDTYLKYIQFRTLHHRFYTNEKLFKVGIKTTNVWCFFCFL